MMEKTPLVSVIMPAYNMERFITPAIRSVQQQTMEDWELLVIDDGSQDRTCQIVEELAAQDSRIRFLRNEVNMGVAKTRNRGFDLCRGEYVALLDSDDVWMPRKLESQLQVARDTGADIVYCSYGMTDERDNRVCADFIVPETTDYAHSLVQSVISCSTALLSRGIVDSYRFVPEYYHEDLVLWLQLLLDGYRACGATEVLASYRLLDGTRASNKARTALNRWRVYRNYLKLPVWKCASLLSQYALLGFRKYKRSESGNPR